MPDAVSCDVAAQLRGVAAMLKVEDKDLKRELNLESRRTLLPYAKGRVAGTAHNRLQAKVARTGTIQTGRGFPFLKFTGKVRGVNLAAATEFGAVGQVKIAYTARNRGGSGTHRVVRRTTAQFRPRVADGKFIYPAVETMTDAASAAWLQVVEDVYGKRVSRGT